MMIRQVSFLFFSRIPSQCQCHYQCSNGLNIPFANQLFRAYTHTSPIQFRLFWMLLLCACCNIKQYSGQLHSASCLNGTVNEWSIYSTKTEKK